MPDISIFVRLLVLLPLNLLILLGSVGVATIAPMLVDAPRSQKKWWTWLLVYLMFTLPFGVLVMLVAAWWVYWQGDDWLALALAHVPLLIAGVFTGIMGLLLWRETRQEQKLPTNRDLPTDFFEEITHPTRPRELHK